MRDILVEFDDKIDDIILIGIGRPYSFGLLLTVTFNPAVAYLVYSCFEYIIPVLGRDFQVYHHAGICPRGIAISLKPTAGGRSKFCLDIVICQISFVVPDLSFLSLFIERGAVR